jgi:hypothetical protein
MLHEIIWQQNVRLAEVCLHHPFVRGLADGTLDPEAFRRYVAQDTFFLNAFARAYALAAARSQDEETLISHERASSICPRRTILIHETGTLCSRRSPRPGPGWTILSKGAFNRSMRSLIANRRSHATFDS